MHQQFAIPDGATRANEFRRGAADPTRPSGRSPWRMILLASLGGALELYDFVVFGVFASAIGAAFFPMRIQARRDGFAPSIMNCGKVGSNLPA